MTKKEEFAEKNNISIEDVNYLIRNTSLFCECGDFKKLTKSSQSKIGIKLHSNCAKPECSPLYGKKRPEHSEMMKELAKDPHSSVGKTVFQKGVLSNKEVNSLEFKRKVLNKLGIFPEEENIEVEYSEYMSTRSKDREIRTKTMVTKLKSFDCDFSSFLSEVAGVELTRDNIEKLSEEKFNSFFTLFHGVSTLQNSRNILSKSSNFFKSEILYDLKYNSSGLTSVRTRSGWETSAIRIFESEGIMWSYEEIMIPTIDKKGLYVPDFKIEFQEKTYLIEIKGGFFNQDEVYYMKNKVLAGMRFAEDMGWKFLFTQKEPKTIGFLNDSIDLGEKYGLS